MQSKTLTTLGSLRLGDSFVFQRRTDAWRVISRSVDGKWTFINQIINGRQVYKHDEQKRSHVVVMFLRHTLPVPGEEIFLEDLQPGDVFQQMDDVVHEWELISKGHDFYDVRRLDEPAPGKAGRLAKVVFVRHKTDQS
jgi:hypothetical protein